MRIRLHGHPDDIAPVVDALYAAVTVHDVSRPYPDRPPSQLVRVYIDGKARTADTTEDGR